MNRHKNFLWFSVALFAMSTQLAAQGNSQAAMEQIKMERLWFNSQNAAGTVFDDVTAFSDLKLSYDMSTGDYRRPQEGRKVNDVGVFSEGFMNLGNVYVWGSFSFMQRMMTDAGYNASITDPFRGMPYYVIDTHQSKWRNQYYDLAFRVATPLVAGHWGFGIDGAYQASMATKQRDPRVDTRFYRLSLTPGVTYKIDECNRLGLSLKYESIKKDSRMENEDTYTDQDYYLLYGLGTAVKQIGNGHDTNYYGDRFGGALQYNYAGNGWNVLFEGGYDLKVENVEQSFTSPKKDAGVKDKNLTVSVSAYRKTREFTHYFNLAYGNRDIDGVQYVSQRDNSESQEGWVEIYKSIRSTYKTDVARAKYAIVKNRGAEYDWKIEAGLNYINQKDEYILPYSVKASENMVIDLCGKKNFVLGDKMNNRLLVDIHVACSNNLSGRYNYGGTHADYISVTELETRDAQYLNSDYWRLGASVTYSQQVKRNDKINMFVGVGFDRIEVSDYDFSGRSFLSISAGCNF